MDSIQGQTYPDWEVVLVNDTGEKWASDIMGAPFAKVINMEGNQGASAARNEGVKHISASSKFVVWMDADDFWLPWFLERMVNYAENNKGVIFSDLLISDKPESFKIYKYNEFVSERVINTMQYPGSSILTPRYIADAMIENFGGFDVDSPGMEDWQYQIGVHSLGFCAFHIPEPLFVYRTYTSTKRDTDYARINDILAHLDIKFSEYRTGVKQIMCGCNSPKIPQTDMPTSLLSSSGNFNQESVIRVTDPESKQSMVMVEYTGPNVASFTINSRAAPRVSYRFGNNENHRVRPVFVGDVDFLLGLNTAGIRDFHVVSNIAVPDTHDPAAFLGAPITA